MQLRLLLSLATAALAVSLAGVCRADTLKICADQNYLPYSNQAQQGFENAVAKAVAGYLGDDLVYTWSSYRGHGGYERFLARTLDSGRCDVVLDVPSGSPGALTTAPYYASSYVFVFKKTSGYNLRGMDSPLLHKVKIGFERHTPAEDGLKLRDLIETAVPFDIARHPSESPRRMLDAVRNGTVQVMITWEPAISGFLHDYPDLQIVRIPNTSATGNPEIYTFPMSMGVRPDDKALADKIDAVIQEIGRAHV